MITNRLPFARPVASLKMLAMKATAVSLAIGMTTPLAAAPLIGEPQVYGVGDFPTGMAAGFLNVDDQIDVVTANAVTRDVSVRSSHAMGGFFQESRLALGEEARDVVIGDVDGDLVNDLVVCVRDGSAGIFVFTALPHGIDGFNLPVPYGDPLSGFIGAFSIVMDDFNGDGAPDVAVSHAEVDASQVTVYLNDGAGGFANFATYDSAFSDVVYVTDVASGDMDGDGDVDLVATLINTGHVRLLRNAGDGTFGAPEAVGLDGLAPKGIAVGDLDDDGDLDYAVVRVTVSGDDGLLIGLNTGDGSATSMTFPIGNVQNSFTSPAAVTIDDFDGDGVANEVVVQGHLVQMTNGVLSGVAFDPLGYVLDVQRADLSFTPGIEIVMSIVNISDFHGSVVVRGVTPNPDPPCSSDINASGAVDLSDLLIVLTSWGPCPGGGDECAADVNQDDEVGLADLLAVLAAWGPC